VGDVCQRMRCEHLGAHVARPAQARATLKGSVTIPRVGYVLVWMWGVLGITAFVLCCCRVSRIVSTFVVSSLPESRDDRRPIVAPG